VAGKTAEKIVYRRLGQEFVANFVSVNNAHRQSLPHDKRTSLQVVLDHCTIKQTMRMERKTCNYCTGAYEKTSIYVQQVTEDLDWKDIISNWSGTQCTNCSSGRFTGESPRLKRRRKVRRMKL